MDCEVGEEGFNLCGMQCTRMALVVKQDNVFHPVHVSFFGTDGIVLNTQGLPNLVEEFWCLGWQNRELRAYVQDAGLEHTSYCSRT